VITMEISYGYYVIAIFSANTVMPTQIH